MSQEMLRESCHKVYLEVEYRGKHFYNDYQTCLVLIAL